MAVFFGPLNGTMVRLVFVLRGRGPYFGFFGGASLF